MWGGKWDKNSNRPYFEGHEREDVIASRKDFIKHFLENKQHYYFTERDERGWPVFKLPKEEKRILIAHDESTYRSSEMASMRWMFPDTAPFFNKGRGRSLMVSAFLVLHNISMIFKLDDDEWKTALRFFNF